MNTAIDQHRRVTLHFALALESGEQIDSTFERQPASFVMGDGSLLPGFERVLLGMQAGQRGEFQIAAQDAFGQPNPNNIQRFDRDSFAPDMELQPGLVISFADARQGQLPGVVKALEGDQVVVDFNHPLAGKTLSFAVEIIHVDAPADD